MLYNDIKMKYKSLLGIPPAIQTPSPACVPNGNVNPASGSDAASRPPYSKHGSTQSPNRRGTLLDATLPWRRGFDNGDWGAITRDGRCPDSSVQTSSCSRETASPGTNPTAVLEHACKLSSPTPGGQRSLEGLLPWSRTPADASIAARNYHGKADSKKIRLSAAMQVRNRGSRRRGSADRSQDLRRKGYPALAAIGADRSPAGP